MSAEYSVDGILAVAEAADNGDVRHPGMVADMLRAYAERIEADERAVQVETVRSWPKFVQAECLEVLRNMDTELGATGRKSARIERLIDAIAGLTPTEPTHPHSPDAAETTNPPDADTLSKPPRFGGCCCGEPCTLGVVHRTDGPCFVYEQPADSGRVGDEFKFTDEDIRLALDYSRNYATARPDISPTAKEHVSGLCDRLESLLADRAALASQGQGESCPYCDGTGDVHSIDGEWCGECTACPAAMEHAFKNFHRQLCERFGCAHDEKDWRRDQVSLIEHIAAKVQASPAGVPDGMVLVPRWIIGNTLRAIRDVDTQFRATGHPSWRFEQLANLLAPLAATPSAPEGGEVGL